MRGGVMDAKGVPKIEKLNLDFAEGPVLPLA